MPIGETGWDTNKLGNMSPRWAVECGKRLRMRKGCGKTVVAGDAQLWDSLIHWEGSTKMCNSGICYICYVICYLQTCGLINTIRDVWAHSLQHFGVSLFVVHLWLWIMQIWSTVCSEQQSYHLYMMMLCGEVGGGDEWSGSCIGCLTAGKMTSSTNWVGLRSGL